MQPATQRTIRVSCSSICSIRVRNGYLLTLNRNRLRKGERVLSPVGGALEWTDPGIVHRFGAMPESAASKDLRLFLPVDRLACFGDWFRSREGRELTPFREVEEELVREMRLLEGFDPADCDARFTRVADFERATDRTGLENVMTHYFFEVWRLDFTPQILGRLAARSEDPDRVVAIASETEILKGRCGGGEAIADNAVLLVNR